MFVIVVIPSKRRSSGRGCESPQVHQKRIAEVGSVRQAASNKPCPLIRFWWACIVSTELDSGDGDTVGDDR